MNKPPVQPAAQPRLNTSPAASGVAESDGWTSAAQAERLVHELRVHQIELEMQNEELRGSRAEVESGLKRFTELYDFAPVGYLTLSPDSSMRELNLPAARLLGRERSRLVGGRFRIFVSPESRVVFDAWLAGAFAEQERATSEVVLLGDALPHRYVQLEARLSPDAQSVRAVVTDITSRKALEGELRQAQKMEVIGQLAGGVAHDFNNILAAMILNLGMLRLERGAPPRDEEALQSLDGLVNRASSLTNQLLLFSRRQALQTRRLELNAALAHLLQMLDRLLGEEILCTLRADPSEVWVDADLAMLEQAVMNLCLNARDAMPLGGALTLETSVVDFDTASVPAHPGSRPGQFVRLRVSDTGCGMGEEVLKHVFEPFFTTKEIGKGSGLGLASVHGSIHQHRGWLNVESRVGRGTTFSLYLPLMRKPESLPAVPLEALAARGKGETVLLVEDEPALLSIGARALTRLGYRVFCAADGPQALVLWEQHADVIDLVVTDMRMPNGISGLALAEVLSKTKPALKIVIMSGYSSELGTDAGAAAVEFTYLAKPFDLDILAKTVRRCLGEPLAENNVDHGGNGKSEQECQAVAVREE